MAGCTCVADGGRSIRADALRGPACRCACFAFARGAGPDARCPAMHRGIPILRDAFRLYSTAEPTPNEKPNLARHGDYLCAPRGSWLHRVSYNASSLDHSIRSKNCLPARSLLLDAMAPKPHCDTSDDQYSQCPIACQERTPEESRIRQNSNGLLAQTGEPRRQTEVAMHCFMQALM